MSVQHYDTAIIDFDALREQEPALYKSIAKVTGFAGNHLIELNSLVTAYQNALRDWLEKKYVPATAAKPPQPEVKVGTKTEEAEKAKRRAADHDAALRRLRQYEAEQLLLNCGRNRDLIEEWIKKNVNGYWSSGAVDCAIANLGPRGRNWLVWGQKPEPPKPVEPLLPIAPPEVLGTCSDGMPQLPIDSPVWVLQKATVEQIKDYKKRRMQRNPQEGIIRRKGFFGSRFEG